MPVDQGEEERERVGRGHGRGWGPQSLTELPGSIRIVTTVDDRTGNPIQGARVAFLARAAFGWLKVAEVGSNRRGRAAITLTPSPQDPALKAQVARTRPCGRDYSLGPCSIANRPGGRGPVRCANSARSQDSSARIPRCRSCSLRCSWAGSGRRTPISSCSWRGSGVLRESRPLRAVLGPPAAQTGAFRPTHRCRRPLT